MTHARCDGVRLARSSDVPSAHNWVSDGSIFMRAAEYVVAIQARYNYLFCLSRRTTGRSGNNLCSRGCAQPETLNHIVQACYTTHGLRIRRHDDLANYVKHSLTQKGLAVHSEPRFDVPGGTFMKPDLVAYSTNQTFLIDLQVRTDQFDLQVTTDQFDFEKAHKPRSKSKIFRPQLDPLRPGGAIITSLTVNWR